MNLRLQHLGFPYNGHTVSTALIGVKLSVYSTQTPIGQELIAIFKQRSKATQRLKGLQVQDDWQTMLEFIFNQLDNSENSETGWSGWSREKLREFLWPTTATAKDALTEMIRNQSIAVCDILYQRQLTRNLIETATIKPKNKTEMQDHIRTSKVWTATDGNPLKKVRCHFWQFAKCGKCNLTLFLQPLEKDGFSQGTIFT
jgi:hypothetical protein